MGENCLKEAMNKKAKILLNTSNMHTLLKRIMQPYDNSNKGERKIHQINTSKAKNYEKRLTKRY